jgi:hypothetical protein
MMRARRTSRSLSPHSYRTRPGHPAGHHRKDEGSYSRTRRSYSSDASMRSASPPYFQRHDDRESPRRDRLPPVSRRRDASQARTTSRRKDGRAEDRMETRHRNSRSPAARRQRSERASESVRVVHRWSFPIFITDGFGSGSDLEDPCTEFTPSRSKEAEAKVQEPLTCWLPASRSTS